jgi:serine protein kinase
MPDQTNSGTDRIETVATSFKERSPDDLRETYSVEWYLNEFVENPEVGRSAHQRLADMFEFYGTEYNEADEIVEYKLASEDPIDDGDNVFHGRNVHEAIHEFVDKIHGAARGLGPDKRIVLLTGPVGSGKSDFDKQMRKYFEDYTSSDEGRMYTFQWTNLTDVIDDQDPDDDTVRSPMNQDPIVLIPQDEREQIIGEANENLDAPYTIENEQNLDPESAFYLDELLAHYDGDLQQVFDNHVEVIRMQVDETKRQGEATMEPKDKKNQDETELTGDVNYSKLAVYSESDPRAFDYSGAFCNANRGVFSGEELLKLQKEFLYDFLHATQERTIKPQNNPRIDIDQVIVGRTNMPEYREKRSDETMEAFNDRTKRVDFPYVLQYSEEANIYDKLLSNADADDVHVEPHTLEMAGLFAVLTRLDDPDDDTSLVTKAKAYDDPTDEAEVDVEALRSQANEEGMSGVSPRFVGDELSESIMHELHEESDSLTPLTVLNHLEQNLDLHASIPEERHDDYYRYLELVREEYKERAIEDVRHALAYDKDEIMSQGNKYMDHVMAYIDDETVEDDLTGEHIEPDEEFMRAVEEQIDVPEDRKDTFRTEVSHWISRRAREGEPFDPTDNEKLRTALERKIWNDRKHNINFSALVSEGDEGDDEWIESLKEMGYSEAGAEEVLDFAGASVAKAEMERSV